MITFLRAFMSECRRIAALARTPDMGDTAAKLRAVVRWQEHGPCAPQCLAECDGACAAEILPRARERRGVVR